LFWVVGWVVAIIRITDLELFFYDIGHGQCDSIHIQKELRRRDQIIMCLIVCWFHQEMQNSILKIIFWSDGRFHSSRRVDVIMAWHHEYFLWERPIDLLKKED
jgi:hypothetical protein